MGFVVRGLEIVRYRFAPAGALAVVSCLLLGLVPMTPTDGAPDPLVQYSISIDPTDAEARVKAGEGDILAFDVMLAVEQPSRTRSRFDLEAHVSTGWDIDMDTAPHMIPGTGMWVFPCTVFVPPEAVAEVTAVLEVTATHDATGPLSSSQTARANITVRPYCAGCLRVYPSSVSLWGGDSVQLEGQVFNNGNANYTFKLGVDNPHDELDAVVRPSTLKVTPGGSKAFGLDVTAEDGIPPGLYALDVEMVSVPIAGEPKITASQEITVDTNPVRAVLKVEPTRVPPGMDVTFDAGDSSVGAGPAKYMFDFGDGMNTGWKDAPVVVHSYAREGVFTARLTVEGEGGVRSTNDPRVTVTVTTEGFRPSAEITSLTPSPAHLGTEVTLTGRATPVPGANIEVYQWNSSIDGALGTGAVLRTTYLSRGIHTISLQVRDVRGTWSDPATTELEVLPPRSAWVVRITSPGDGAHLKGSTVKVEGTASFADVQLDGVDVRVDGGPWTVAQGRCQWTMVLDLTGIADGEHVLEVRARGGGSVSDPVSIRFRTGEVGTSLPLVGEVSGVQLAVGLVVALVILGAILWTRHRGPEPVV